MKGNGQNKSIRQKSRWAQTYIKCMGLKRLNNYWTVLYRQKRLWTNQNICNGSARKGPTNDRFVSIRQKRLMEPKSPNACNESGHKGFKNDRNASDIDKSVWGSGHEAQKTLMGLVAIGRQMSDVNVTDKSSWKFLILMVHPFANNWIPNVQKKPSPVCIATLGLIDCSWICIPSLDEILSNSWFSLSL